MLPVQVYGISMDKPASQAKWRKKEGISFNLLCDPDKEVSTTTHSSRPAPAGNRAAGT
jgi:peroxiredoxin